MQIEIDNKIYDIEIIKGINDNTFLYVKYANISTSDNIKITAAYGEINEIEYIISYIYEK